MTRIERGNGWEMRLGKWQDSPPAHDPVEVDVVLADPPYGERTHQNGQRGSGWTGDNREIHERATKSFKPIEPGDIAAWLVGLTRRWVVFFCEIEQIRPYADAVGGPMGGVWIRGGMAPKRNPVPQFSGDRPGTPGDCLAIMHRPGRKRWNGGGRAALYPWSRARRDRHHETQKPVELMVRLVRHYSEPGELVWDPYAGLATTGVAALMYGRRFLGHELQEHYFDRACDRLRAAEQSQSLELFAAGGHQAMMFDTDDLI